MAGTATLEEVAGRSTSKNSRVVPNDDS